MTTNHSLSRLLLSLGKFPISVVMILDYSTGSVFVLTHILLPTRPLVILHVAHSSGMFQCVSDIKEGLNESLTSTLCTRTDGQTTKRGTRSSGDVVEDTGDILSCTRFPETAPYKSVNTFYSISSLEIALRGILFFPRNTINQEREKNQENDNVFGDLEKFSKR